MRLTTVVLLALVPAYAVSMALKPRQTTEAVHLLLPRNLIPCTVV